MLFLCVGVCVTVFALSSADVGLLQFSATVSEKSTHQQRKWDSNCKLYTVLNSHTSVHLVAECIVEFDVEFKHTPLLFKYPTLFLLQSALLKHYSILEFPSLVVEVTKGDYHVIAG